MRQGIDGSKRNLTAWNHARAVLLLPFMNTVIIPSLLLSIFRDVRLGTGTVFVETTAPLLALPVLAVGLTLVVRAISLFVRQGRGTLAPWDPTEVLITGDIYRLSRNPMKAGLFLVLIGEVLVLRSTALAVWAASFITVNALYIRWFEEPGLVKRFGAEYAEYCRQVPRWLKLMPARRPAARTAERMS